MMQLDETQALSEVQQLLDRLGQPQGDCQQAVAEIVSSLHAMAERYSEAEYQGISDALVLLAELIDPFQQDEHNPQEELLLNAGYGLRQLADSPNLAADPLLSCLADHRWPSPIGTEEVDFLNQVLVSDLSVLSDTHTSIDRPESSDQQVSLSALSAQMQAILVYQSTSCPADDMGSEKLISGIYQLAEACSEGELAGFSDLFALYVELLQQIGVDAYSLQNEMAIELHQHISDLVENPTVKSIDAVMLSMTANPWPEPLMAADLEFLKTLLLNDVKHLALFLKDSQPSSDAASKAQPVEQASEALIEDDLEPETDPNVIAEIAVLQESFAIETMPSTEPASSVEQAPQSEPSDIPGTLYDSMQHALNLQQSVETKGAGSGEQLIEYLYQLVEQCSEQNYQGYSDLFALYLELIQSQGEEAISLSNEISQYLHHSLIALLSNPTAETVNDVLTLMSSDRWLQPLPIEDLDFLKPLLSEDSDRLAIEFSIVDREHSVFENHQHTVEEQVADEPEVDELSPVSSTALDLSSDIQLTDAETPAFLEVDFDLLKEPQPAVDAAVVTMLAESMAVHLQPWKQLESTPRVQLLDDTVTQLGAISRALDTVGLRGARFVADGLIGNISWLGSSQEQLNDTNAQLLNNALIAFETYLLNLTDKACREALIDDCANLPCALDVEQAAFLSGLLALASIQDVRSLERQSATMEEISLSCENDVDPELKSMLYNELPQLSEEFTQQLLAIIEEENSDTLLDAQRTAHTIKGLANMAGIRGLASLTHYLEDILELLTEAAVVPGKSLGEDLLAASDCLSAMCDAVVADEATPDNALTNLQQILDWHYLAKTEGISAITIDGEHSPVAQVQDQPGEISEAVISKDIAENLGENIGVDVGISIGEDVDANASAEAESLADRSSVLENNISTDLKTAPSSAPVKAQSTPAETDKSSAQTMPVSLELLDRLFRIAGESTTLNSQLNEELTQLRRLSRSGRDRYRAMERVMVDLEQSLNEYSRLNASSQSDDKDFDPLEMDRYNELHSSISRLHEAAADVSEVNTGMDGHIRQLTDLHGSQSGLQKETLENVIRTRMVPVSSISTRVQRILRQACRAADKKARLVIEGEGVMIDSQILNQLTDPLMHIIRNAVDHGLESAHSRFEKDKPKTGTITLKFQQDHELIKVSCCDDGAGIDTQRVFSQAVEKGLIDADTQLSESETQRLVLIPGFSTREEISHLSGRGIGMDVVSQRVAALHGRVQINSTQGQGTEIELALPSSSLMLRVLLVWTGSQLVALSTQGIEQSLLSIDGSLQQRNQGLVFVTDEKTYPAFSIESLTSKPEHDYASGRIHPVLIVNVSQDQQVAVLVRDIVAHRELIFKEMGSLVPPIPGIPGVTILSNGEVAPVIDLPTRVLREDSHKVDAEKVIPLEAQSLPKVMVVDDSISARKSLITLLRDIGYEVSSAIDGLDAMNKIRRDPPDLLLTDYEMPRMNGVELAASVRGREEIEDIPIVMITSRSTSKHRLEADNAGVSRYITKPWTEANLLTVVEDLLAS